MDMREAKRRVCAGAAKLLGDDGENLWLEQDDRGEPLGDDDLARTRAAFNELVAELRRRGQPR